MNWSQWGAQGLGGNWVREKNLVKSRNSRVILLASIQYATAQILESMLGKSHDFNAITLDGINHETENLTFTIIILHYFSIIFLLVSIISKETEHFLVINPLYKHYSHN